MFISTNNSNDEFLKDLLSLNEDKPTSGGAVFKAPDDQNTDAAPKKDGFTLPKGIKFDSSQELSQKQAAELVQQAHDKAEEVDTIAFGLELNDGEIVKVYVATPDAEGFEKAMSDLLGKEDDIEAAINELAGEFDIVSVEWPGEDMTGSGEEGDGTTIDDVGDAAASEDDSNVDDLADKKEKKTKLSFDLNAPDDDEGEDKEGEPDDDKKEDEEDGLDGLDFGNLPSKDKEEEKPDEEEEEEEPDEDKEPEDGKKPAPKKAKGKKPSAKSKKEETLKDSLLWPFSSFLGTDYIAEAADKKPVSIDGRKEKKEEDKAEQKIEDLFKTVMQRKIIRLILMLGMPALRLNQGRSELRHGVREAALGLISNPKGRLFLHRTLTELESIIGSDAADKSEKELTSAKSTDDVKESDETSHVGQGTAKMFEHLLDVLRSLGVPNEILHTRKSPLRQALKPTIALLLKHGKLRNYFNNLGRALGHKHHVEDKMIEEAVDLGDDAYLQLVSNVVAALGIPDENLNYKRSNVIQSLRKKKQEIGGGLSATRARMIALLKVLGLATQQQNEELMITEDIHRRMKEKAVDLGTWSIGRTGDSCRLAIDSVEIKLNSLQTQQLVHAIDNGFETTIKAGNEHYNFKPIDHGREYIVIPLDSDNEFHHSGIKMGKRSVEAFINLW